MKRLLLATLCWLPLATPATAADDSGYEQAIVPVFDKIITGVVADSRRLLDPEDAKVLDSLDVRLIQDGNLFATVIRDPKTDRPEIQIYLGLVAATDFLIQSAIADLAEPSCGLRYLELFYAQYDQLQQEAADSVPLESLQLKAPSPLGFLRGQPDCQAAADLLRADAGQWHEVYELHFIASLLFVVLHELGHLRLGHVASFALPVQDPLHRQRIEAAADQWAMDRIVRFAPPGFALPVLLNFAIVDSRFGRDPHTMPHVHGRIRVRRLLDNPDAVAPGASLADMLGLLKNELETTRQEGINYVERRLPAPPPPRQPDWAAGSTR